MKTIFKLALLLLFIKSHAQIGINTTSPDAQLDIEATNAATPSNTDGLLIPRVNVFPATNPTAAQQGMMVYLMVTSGANTPGFYYWDNLTTNWIGISSKANDKAWYEVGTTVSPNAITDDMFHTGKVGIGISTPSSKLHAMNSASGMTPNAESVITLENSTNTYLSLLSGNESGVLFGSNGVATDGGIIYGSAGLPRGMVLRTNGNINRMVISDAGNISVGNFIATYPLQFPSSVGDKISLWGGGVNHYGLGIQGNLLQIHADIISSDIAFGYGSSAAFTENMRIKGNGNVGIGIVNPLSKLHVRTNASGMTPNPESIATIENDVNTYISLLSGSESGILFGANAVSTNGGIIYNPPAYTNGMVFRTNSNANRMVISDVGNVAIGDFTPNFPLHFSGTLGDKISLWGNGANHYGFGIQGNLLQIHSDIAVSDVAFGYGSSASFTERMRIKGNGNVGIGITNPDYPLQFATGTGDKISLFGGTGSHYGFGIEAFAMQIHSAGITDDIAFGYGSSAAFTETMRIKGTGKVGIGTPTPTAELEVNGFTKMGTTAPAVKMIKLTGTTGAVQGNTTFMTHGLTSNKILAVNILVEYAASASVPPSYNGSAGYEYDYYINATSIAIWTKSGNAASILSKPIRVLVTYEE